MVREPAERRIGCEEEKKTHTISARGSRNCERGSNTTGPPLPGNYSTYYASSRHLFFTRPIRFFKQNAPEQKTSKGKRTTKTLRRISFCCAAATRKFLVCHDHDGLCALGSVADENFTRETFQERSKKTHTTP